MRVWFCFNHKCEANELLGFCEYEGEWGSGNPNNCDLDWAWIERIG